MQPQTPAQGIIMQDALTYYTQCDCEENSHAVKTWIETSAEPGFGVDVTFFVKTWTPASLAEGGLWQRIKKAASILFTGVDTQQHGIVLREQVALNWISAVNSSIEDLHNDASQ